MMRTKMISALAACAMALAACGGGGGGAASVAGGGGGGTTVSGVANLGKVTNGTVTAYKLVNGAKGAQLGTATTAADGSFTITFNGYTGPVLFELTPTAQSTYLDEATGVATALPTTPNFAVQSVLPKAGANASVAITPLTDIVAAAVAKKANPTAKDIEQAAAYVAGQLGLNGVDILTTKPADIGNPNLPAATTAKQKHYARVLAAVAKVANNGPGGAVDPATYAKGSLGPGATGLFDASGNPASLAQKKTTLTALHTATTNYASPAGANFATLPAPPTPVSSSLGKTYYYVYQSYQDNDANVDSLEIGTVTFPTTNGGNAPYVGISAWGNNGVIAAYSGSMPLTVNPDGSWMAQNAFGGNVTSDGMVIAGVNIGSGGPTTDIIYGVQKPATNITQAQLAGKTFDFVAQGGTHGGGAMPAMTQDKGSITFAQNGTATVTMQSRLVGQTWPAPSTSTVNYSIIASNGLIKININTATSTGVIYIAPSANLQYGAFAEYIMSNATGGPQFKNAGFAILHSVGAPALANTAYHYFTAYYTSNSSLVTAPNNKGPQAEQGTVLLAGANASGSVPGNGVLISMRLEQNQAGQPSSPVECGPAAVTSFACAGAAFSATFTPGANGTATTNLPGNPTMFVSSDGNVAIAPGLVAIKQ